MFDFRTFTALGADIRITGMAQLRQAEEDASGRPGRERSPDVWKQIKPDAKDVDGSKITDLLTTLSNLHADKVRGQGSRDRRRAGGDRAIGEAASPKTEKVTFRKSGTVVHAIRAGEPGAMIVPTADFDRAVTSFKEIAGIK